MKLEPYTVISCPGDPEEGFVVLITGAGAGMGAGVVIGTVLIGVTGARTLNVSELLIASTAVPPVVGWTTLSECGPAATDEGSVKLNEVALREVIVGRTPVFKSDWSMSTEALLLKLEPNTVTVWLGDTEEGFTELMVGAEVGDWTVGAVIVIVR